MGNQYIKKVFIILDDPQPDCTDMIACIMSHIMKAHVDEIESVELII